MITSLLTNVSVDGNGQWKDVSAGTWAIQTQITGTASVKFRWRAHPRLSTVGSDVGSYLADSVDVVTHSAASSMHIAELPQGQIRAEVSGSSGATVNSRMYPIEVASKAETRIETFGKNDQV